MIIGQERVKDAISKMIDSGFPRFTIIAGGRQSGKRLLAGLITKLLNAPLVVVDTKVDSIREVIQLAYKQSEPTVYLIPSADKMSPAAKNALLKVTEEPPRKAYFIMTLHDLSNTLGTLRSRGSVLSLDPYTPSQLLDYAAKSGYALTGEEADIITEICTTPGEVDTLIRYDISSFYDYVYKVVDSIGVVTGVNAFKITTKLSMKADDGLWDIQLFFRAVMAVCSHELKETGDVRYAETIRVTCQYASEIGIVGIHKLSTVDMWIIQLRRIWKEN